MTDTVQDTVPVQKPQGLARLRLLRELASLVDSIKAGLAPLAKLKALLRVTEIVAMMGVSAAPTQAAEPPPPEKTADEYVEAIVDGDMERRSTAHLYSFDPNRKLSQRRRDNLAARDLLAQIDAGTVDPKALTEEQKRTLALYSGAGGGLEDDQGREGSAYEYYTPKPIAEAMWHLLREIGFSGGRVLDPCSAVGVFGAVAPVNAAVDAVELNSTSGRINDLVNGGPGYAVTVAPFEQVAAATPDDVYDAVITNVPFGPNSARGGNELLDTRYQSASLETYFILRSLEKLRPRGVAAFITPPRCVSGKDRQQVDLRIEMSKMAEFVGAYRLPNSVFGHADADTITDVIVLRKFDAGTLEKIRELEAQSPATLTDANVLWPEFIEGGYFRGEGARFVLGTVVPKDPTKFRDVDRVVHSGSTADIAKLLTKFGHNSRIDWGLLGAVETLPIVYAEGDTLVQAGQTLEMQGGRWVARQRDVSEVERERQQSELLAKLGTPLQVVTEGVTFAQAQGVVEAMKRRGKGLDVPDWVRGVVAQIDRVQDALKAGAWHGVTVGLAIDWAMERGGGEADALNYLEHYPALSAAMKRHAGDAKRVPPGLSSRLRTAAAKVGIHYSHRLGYSAVWRGDVAASAEDLRSLDAKFEAAKYLAGGAWVKLADAKAALGETFDPLSDDAWCISPDGQSVCKASDYYVGRYSDFLAAADKAIEAASSDENRDKLVRQKHIAGQMLQRVDPRAMNYNLFTPFATLEQKADFLRQFVDPRVVVGWNKDGELALDLPLDDKSGKDAEKLARRFVIGYLATGNVTLNGVKTDMGDAKAMEALRDMVQRANAQFSAWCRANPAIMAPLEARANDPENLYFQSIDDESPLTIPGLSAEWAKKLNGYQSAWVRSVGREFGGINGFDVGLGKTASSLVAVQHTHAIGTKKRTMFVVPPSVLSNWRKEAASVYGSLDGCLFVGLDTDSAGGFSVTPGNYDRDLTRILEGRYNKIFLTYPAFGRLRLREETANRYDEYMMDVDDSYAGSEKASQDEAAKSRRAKMIQRLVSAKNKSTAAPYFEDLKVDSLVFDEGHTLKNARAAVNFSGGRYLSLSPVSDVALDAHAKAWYVRGENARGDGCILLTATPITNSPLEMYSMMAIAVGDKRVSSMTMGLRGADEFLRATTEMREEQELTIDGRVKSYSVFQGLTNLDMLRPALHTVCTIKTAADVGATIVVPDTSERKVSVVLSDAQTQRLEEYKLAFRGALAQLRGDKLPADDPEKLALELVMERLQEPVALVGSPFNLMTKMRRCILDPELDDGATFYLIQPAQFDLAEKVVEKYNAGAPKDERPLGLGGTPALGQWADPSTPVELKKKKDAGRDVTVAVIKMLAKVDRVGARVIIDGQSEAAQDRFEELADKAGLNLDVTVSPKLAAFLTNFQAEEAHPRGVVGGKATRRVRQIVFCDELSLIRKLRRMLVNRCNIPMAQIAIITGQTNAAPDEILDIQNGFNAEADGENKYRIVLASKKAEVGLNLQRGTQAIHHLTIRWTPDSQIQRNGRGARQGNETETVHVYHYDADGTFDNHLRTTVNRKADWIGQVMARDGGNSVDISGSGLNAEQQAAMINAVGDAQAMSKLQGEIEKADLAARVESTRRRQLVSVQTIKSQRVALEQIKDSAKWVTTKVLDYLRERERVKELSLRVAGAKTEQQKAERGTLLAERKAVLDKMRAQITESVVFTKKAYTSRYEKPQQDSVVDVDQAIEQYTPSYGSRGETLEKRIAEKMPMGVFVKVEIVDGSSLANQRETDISMAECLISESFKSFEMDSKRQGGFSGGLLQKIEEDKAIVWGNKIVCEGAFVRMRDGVLWCVTFSQDKSLFKVTRDRTIYMPLAGAMATAAELFVPYDDNYSDCATEAAAIEDKLSSDGVAFDDKRLIYSKIVPQVAERRSVATLTKYSQNCILPSPYFPYLLNIRDGKKASPFVGRLVEKQKDIVRSIVNSYPTGFIAAADAGIVDPPPGYPSLTKCLADAAKAEGGKLTYDDLSCVDIHALGYFFKDAIDNVLPSLMDISKSCATLGEFDLMVKEKLKSSAPEYEIESDPRWNNLEKLSTLIYAISSAFQASFLTARNSITLRAEAAKKAQEDAAKAAELPAKPAEPATKPAELTTTPQVKPEPPVDVDTERMVGVTGDTRPYFSTLKQIAKDMNAPCLWDPVALTWNTQLKVFQKLVELKPGAKQALKVVDPTRSARGRK